MRFYKKAIGIVAVGYILVTYLISCIPVHSVNFITEACIIPYQKYDYHTCVPIHVNIDGEIYVIPKGFTTDLASIPKPFWSFISPQFTGYVAPAILHDYLYSCGNLFNRRTTDEILYSALLSEGVGRYTASKFYVAVRIFGRQHFADGINICTRMSL